MYLPRSFPVQGSGRPSPQADLQFGSPSRRLFPVYESSPTGAVRANPADGPPVPHQDPRSRQCGLASDGPVSGDGQSGSFYFVPPVPHQDPRSRQCGLASNGPVSGDGQSGSFYFVPSGGNRGVSLGSGVYPFGVGIPFFGSPCDTGSDLGGFGLRHDTAGKLGGAGVSKTAQIDRDAHWVGTASPDVQFGNAGILTGRVVTAHVSGDPAGTIDGSSPSNDK